MDQHVHGMLFVPLVPVLKLFLHTFLEQWENIFSKTCHVNLWATKAAKEPWKNLTTRPD